MRSSVVWDFDFGSGGEGLFDRFFRRRHAGPERGENVEVIVQIPLERVATGGKESIRLRNVRAVQPAVARVQSPALNRSDVTSVAAPASA